MELKNIWVKDQYLDTEAHEIAALTVNDQIAVWRDGHDIFIAYCDRGDGGYWYVSLYLSTDHAPGLIEALSAIVTEGEFT